MFCSKLDVNFNFTFFFQMMNVNLCNLCSVQELAKSVAEIASSVRNPGRVIHPAGTSKESDKCDSIKRF